MAGSYGSCIFNFTSNLCTICHSGYTDLHSYQNAQAFPFLDVFANMWYLVLLADSHSNRYKVYRFCSSPIKKCKEIGATTLNNILFNLILLFQNVISIKLLMRYLTFWSY